MLAFLINELSDIIVQNLILESLNVKQALQNRVSIDQNYKKISDMNKKIILRIIKIVKRERFFLFLLLLFF